MPAYVFNVKLQRGTSTARPIISIPTSTRVLATYVRRAWDSPLHSYGTVPSTNGKLRAQEILDVRLRIMTTRPHLLSGTHIFSRVKSETRVIHRKEIMQIWKQQGRATRLLPLVALLGSMLISPHADAST